MKTFITLFSFTVFLFDLIFLTKLSLLGKKLRFFFLVAYFLKILLSVSTYAKAEYH